MTPQEGQQIQRIVRRGGGSTDKSHVKWRRALVVHASAGGNTVPVIARLVVTSEDRVREMIHRFNEMGMASLDPQWAGGRPRQITTEDETFNLSAHKGATIRRWAERNRVELCFTPTYSSWANPIEAHFGPLREFVLNNSNHPNHVVLTRRLHDHLRWRNANARAPEVLAAQRRERARVRAEKGRRWGRPASQAA